jgi:hypothetical protein
VVASSVSSAGAEVWSVRQVATYWVTPTWTGYAYGPSFGRFRCIVTSRRADTIKETCTHGADRHAGRISVGLTIQPAPKSP